MHDSISRRTFIGSAGAAGALGALAGVGSVSGPAAVTIALAEDVSGADWVGEEPQIDDADVKEEVTVDVVVVGCSDSGSVAVRSAVENGASVAFVEKADHVNACGSDIAVPNGNIQERYGRKGIVDVDQLVRVHQEESLYQTKEGIARRFCTEMGDVFDWILEADPDVLVLDTIFDDVPDDKADNYLMPCRYPYADESYDYNSEAIPTFPVSVKFPALSTLTGLQVEKAKSEGEVHEYFGHAGRKLIMEDGRCVGVYAENLTDGGYVRLNAKKGVILCTGDYKDNADMLQALTPDVIENGCTTLSILTAVDGSKVCVGDGHKMGIWAGARLQSHHCPMIHHMGGGAGPDGRGVMGINGYLQLNLAGKRFMNEDLPGQQLENQIEQLPGRASYQFFDSAWPEQCKNFPEGHGVVLFCLDEDEAPKNHATNTNWRTKQDIQDAVDQGRCYTSDTLEGLLDQIDDIDRDAALESIARYNEIAANGDDEDFGKDSRRLFPLENPPYYCCKLTPAFNLANMDGLESDEDCHTFDADRNVIPGLYVAGNVQGGRFAYQYPISMPGCSVGFALFYGYVAGKNAALGL
ncbi:MAG: FAD-binding protein [Coriobacteriales bacterium]|jgi:fumarate reductase flavoprotein subunit